MHKYIYIFIILILPLSSAFAQTGSLHGRITSNDYPVEFATVAIENTGFGTITNQQGQFHIHDIPFGKYTVAVSFIGFETTKKELIINKENLEEVLDFELGENGLSLEQVVVTGTKTFKRQTNSPVIVNVLSSKTLDNVQACNLSEGLKFQPGLRVETDCQTCNYTQLRMNGLAGGYSQILINGRPIFSPLTGLYGLEQLPVNMINRIEVIRGGGSSLYGSSAIGGTVNVITNIPKENSFALDYNYQSINGKSNDHIINGNTSYVADNKNSGISFFFNRREREFYDHNGDNFSELPKIENTSFGTNMFFLPNVNQKIELSISNLNEYRFGGEMAEKPAYLTQQSEERSHNVWMGSADYQINFNRDLSSLIAYAAWQNTDRKHYTGLLPDQDSDAYFEHLETPPYGYSTVKTYNMGLQVNHKVMNFFNGINTFTLGTEYVYDDVFDEITAYEYLVDQTTKDLGAFLQSDWEIIPSLTFLSGVRMDIHNLVDNPVFSPRFSLLYKLKSSTQFRLSYGTGFRAPQAFDTDLHIAFSGGGVSRVILSPELEPETSESWSASVNYDKASEKWIAGFTLEGFYTRLNDAFYLQPIGEDAFGEVFEKQNGQGATVQGVTIELRANYNKKVQLETGFTLQTSEFDEKVEYIPGVEGIKEFVRTPNDYGFATLSLDPTKKINAVISYIYTGKMKLPHFAGAPNQTIDEIVETDAFSELNLKLGYTFNIDKIQSKVQIYGGVKNIFNAYQDDFDIGKDRDSNYIYGPAQPRTFYIGLKLMSI